MPPSKHSEPSTKALLSLLAERSVMPLTLEEQFWLGDYGWNKFKALLAESGLDPHNIKHVTGAARMIRINGDRLLPRLAEKLAENTIVSQSFSVQDKKKEEVLRATPMNENHVQQPIDSTTERQPGFQKYAQNGENTVKPERKSGLSIFVRSGYETPFFVVEPNEQEQKKLYVKMVTNSGNSIFIEYEEVSENEQIKQGTEADTRDTLQDDNGLVSVPEILQNGQKEEIALITAISSESSGNEGLDRDAEDPLPHEHTTGNARFMIGKVIEIVRAERQKALRNGSVALSRQEHSG
ncbi:hypothetical protein sscle_15g106230 [Sclerotinia sclerotiorum 1980 UF-70]|uniref:Uncharacterized protein n=1 Tax=Sclerotinia sclerotiorum (strain ATCC 18683 / 1980 / Ss-1) TaxID=665079 RepID=A0A1D9QMP3_SCLS1|nr:hypothetical protein sscle_15g106230 [Sclerotinia sclerotiorum 1980 UF-70]